MVNSSATHALDWELADAHLISAAPELLEALEGILRAHDLPPSGNSEAVQVAARSAARDVIAKAKGVI